MSRKFFTSRPKYSLNSFWPMGEMGLLFTHIRASGPTSMGFPLYRGAFTKLYAPFLSTSRTFSPLVKGLPEVESANHENLTSSVTRFTSKGMSLPS